jgi:DNA-binding transcriptional LysR family regulator
MLAQMELRHLRYFVAVAEEQNISRAALKLHLSQPGLSLQVRDLEDEIGFSLLERSAKSVRLTEAGKVFLIEARGVLQRAADAVNRARTAVSVTNAEINVGYAPSMTVQIMPQALQKFQEKFPNVRVVLHDLSTQEMVTQLREEKLHLALAPRLPAKLLRGLNVEELARYAVCVAVAPKHPLSKSKSISLKRIAREPLIAYSRKDYPEFRENLEKIFARVGHRLRVAGEYDSVTGLAAAVEAGRGFALVPSSLTSMVGPRLKLIPLTPALPAVSVIAIWRKESETEPVKHFIASARRDSAFTRRQKLKNGLR